MINESNTIHFDMHKYSFVADCYSGMHTTIHTRKYILEPTEQVPEKAFWLISKTAALKLHGYLPSESRRASFQMKQLLECKQLQYLAKSNSQIYQKTARYGMCFAIVMVCPGHSWSHNWAGTIGICVTLIHSFNTSVSSLPVTEMKCTALDWTHKNFRN